MNNQIEYNTKLIKGKSRITVLFDYNKEWNERIKAITGSEWSNSLKCWHLPDTEVNRTKFKFH